MPHKVNPVAFEKICGLARLLRAYHGSSLESIALWHERDLTNSSVERITIPDSFCLVDHMLRTFNFAFPLLNVNRERANENISRGICAHSSQRYLLKLVEGGLSRKAGHLLVAEASKRATQSSQTLHRVMKEDDEVNRYLSVDEIDACAEEPELTEVTFLALERVGLRL